jgi:hypothetical protein
MLRNDVGKTDWVIKPLQHALRVGKLPPEET